MEKEYEVLSCYNRECNLNRDYHKVFRVVAQSDKEALDLINNYTPNAIFNDIEDDYIEDSLYAIKIL